MTAGAHRLDVLHRIVSAGLVAFVRTKSRAGALAAATDAVHGGASVVSIRPGADGDFADVRAELARSHPDAMVGAEITSDGAPVEDHLAAGADFIYGRRFDADVARICHDRRTAYLPVCSGEEVMDRAEGTGLDLVCVEPGDASREKLAAAVRARPRSRVVAVEDSPGEEMVASWLKAGAACLGAVVPAEPAGGTDLARWVATALWRVRRSRNWSVYGPVEHVGVYAQQDVSDIMIAEWYAETFDYAVTVGKTLFAGHGIFGRVEVMKQPVGEHCHVGVRVWDFEEAVRDLNQRGRMLEEPVVGPASKLAYLRDRDPAGNLVHIIWRPS